jgi:hypothetical protein
VWALTLAGVFMLATGQWTAVNWLGAVICGLIAAAVTIPLTASGLFHFRFRLRWLGQVAGPLGQVFVDFVIVMVALARCVASGQRKQGAFVARREFPTGGRDGEGTGWRAFVGYVSTWSPNSYVVDIDASTGHRLSHDLIPRRASESPA